ncbi:ribosome maturation factor RimP [Devosia sp.]|uniref:ribosome maturation factor RimP n=1 Tax=Devosia sp. TaxID=1871048 RepID=UPI003265EFC7
MSFDLKEKRYIKETGLEARISAIVEPVANGLGYALVRIKITQENGCTLQIMAEDANGNFGITDCEKLSKDVSPALDVEDPIEREYHLEVSSPGIDRPLVRARDFIAYIGHEAKVELADMLDGRRRFRGPIVAADADSVTIRIAEVPAGTDPDFKLPLAMLADAKLLMTDALMDMARTAQQENNPLDDDEIETEDDDLDEDFDDEDDLDDDDTDDDISEEIH